MTDLIEYQIIRPNGTLLLQYVAPFGEQVHLDPQMIYEFRGEMVTRWRILPDGEWVNTARYPDGLTSTPELIEAQR